MSTLFDQHAMVRTALQHFQDGYTQRDLTTLDAFMSLFRSEPDIYVIGTSAVTMANEEWCVGPSAVRALIAADWQYWSDLHLDVAGAIITLHPPVAWIATVGTLTQHISTGQIAANVMGFVDRLRTAEPFLAPEALLLATVQGAAAGLADVQRGEHHIWPLRLSAVLVQQNDAWQFDHMHFSFPTVYSPQVRM